jgi:hypothetical protein
LRKRFAFVAGNDGEALRSPDEANGSRERAPEDKLRAIRDFTKRQPLQIHFHYENGETGAAIAFLRSWLHDYPRNGYFRGHLSWHLALAHLEQGDVEEGFRLYSDAFAVDDYPGRRW